MQSMSCRLMTAFFLLTGLFLFPAENLLRNGDFEIPFNNIADINDTWTHWGPNEGKIPANVTRDTENPHGGAACLRIFRPANPGSWFGLVVTTPDKNAVRPKAGMKYTITFWTRTDTPGRATLGIFSYKKVNPYVDGPGVANFKFDTGAGWQRQEFAITEGLDFFRDTSQFIYLAFFITSKYDEPKTLWLDDVTVTETPGAATELLNEATVAYDPLPLRLTPGNELSVTVNAKERLRPVNKLVGGVSMLSLGRWTGFPYGKNGEYTMTPKMEEEMRACKFPLTRFYGVIEGEAFSELPTAMDKISSFLERIGIPQESTIIELEDYFANSVLTPQQWAETVAHCLKKGYRYRYWEIGNETYMQGAWGNSKSGKAFPTPESYAEHIRAVAPAIRAVHPGAKIGLSISPNHLKWGNYLLKIAAGSYDFVCPHWYGSGDLDNFEEITLGENTGKLNAALRLNALLKAYNPGRDVFQYDSEWGLHSMPRDGKAADYEPRNANIVGTMYRAIRLLYMAREEVVRGATSWKSYSGVGEPGFGVLFHQAPERRSMLQWLYRFFNGNTGDWVLAMEGSAPFYTPKKYATGDARAPAVPVTPFMASASDDGKTLYLMVANASWSNATPASIVLKGFAPKSAEGTLLSSGDVKAHPLLEKDSDFVSPLKVETAGGALRFILPPHAIVFLTVR